MVLVLREPGLDHDVIFMPSFSTVEPWSEKPADSQEKGEIL
jgi:hypothetical protein